MTAFSMVTAKSQLIDEAVIAMLQLHGGHFSQAALIHQLAESTGFSKTDIAKGVQRLIYISRIHAEVVSPGSGAKGLPEIRLILRKGWHQ